MIGDGLLTKLSKKMLQYAFPKHSVKTRTPLGPRFSSLFSFLPKCKSNWYRYPVLVAQRYQNLNPHCIGLFFTYCLILDLLLNLTKCSSTLWLESLETRRKTTIEVTYYRSKFIGLFLSFWLTTKCKFRKICSNLVLYMTYIIPSLPTYWPHSQ